MVSLRRKKGPRSISAQDPNILFIAKFCVLIYTFLVGFVKF
jgi:hypothetical protein